jgi:tRNA (cytidine/uridine-2'-O-)-methyltransferase
VKGSEADQPQRRVRESAQSAAPLHIVLVEPEIPPNTGNVARLCAATGCALHLVEPLGFRIDDRELKRAGLDYWHLLDVVVHPSLNAFLKTAQTLRCWYLSKKASRVYTDATFEVGDMLVFGKETRGLPDTLIERAAQTALRIPMRDDSVRSINLSTAVGVVAYHALARLRFPGLA